MYANMPNVLVHEGFYIAHKKLFPAANSTILKLIAQHPNAPIYCVGHSLGAALATLTALDLARLYHPQIYLYTYGSPRVGNPAFAQYFETLSS